MIKPVAARDLCWTCDIGALDFRTTDDLSDVTQMFGQDRVRAALQFAVQMDFPGYNIFALGPEDVGKQDTILQYLNLQAELRDAPLDWCYVTNFADPHRPAFLRLPAGRGGTLQSDMSAFVEDCQAALLSAFESDEFHTQQQIIDESLKDRQEQILADIETDGQKHGIALLRTPVGFALSPVKDGKIVPPEEFQARPAAEREKIEAEIDRLQERLKDGLRNAPKLLKEGRDRMRKLRQETASFAVGHLISALREKYADLDDVSKFLESVGNDVVDNVTAFFRSPAGPEQTDGFIGPGGEDLILRRYQVNLLVGDSGRKSAPVIYEDNPTYDRLVGRIEHRAELGALTTDFTLVRPGALHRANGGYLVIDARTLLLHPFAWDGLKHALRMREIRIEQPSRSFGAFSTLSLEPQPIPLDVKVVLVGEPMLYYLLQQHDPEFDDLFKVAADFEDRIDRTPAYDKLYARLIATKVREQKLLPFDSGAVGAIMEQSARRAGDSQKLSGRVERLSNLLREADYHAKMNNRAAVAADDVVGAIKAQTFRSDRVQQRLHAEIIRGTIMIDTDSEKVGQINALSVMGLGDYSFGKPSRVTARVRLGSGKVIDIEREVHLGGPLHSKGVLILSGYLNAHFAPDTPLSLGATLVFEQSYGGVDGDSASSTELYAILSAIAELPIKQSLAVTGSVNQAGEVQAIGGVNEKIEGFFDICAARGLTGKQGVLIPHTNVVNLMLAPRVVDAVGAGKFNIYPVRTIDEGIELLTGRRAGVRQDDGTYPADTVNGMVEARLIAMAKQRRDFARSRANGSDLDIGEPDDDGGKDDTGNETARTDNASGKSIAAQPRQPADRPQ